MGRSLMILGCGYTGRAVAALARGGGWSVIATARSPAGVAALQSAGLQGMQLPETPGHGEISLIADQCAQADAILCSIPADSNGDPAFRALEPALRARTSGWTGYLSTTAVYGDRGGGWVFEQDEPSPTSPRAAARLLAERQWLSLTPPAHVFRLPGIYGPGRSALDKVAAGDARSILKPGQVFSRCHRDDIARGILAALDRPHPGTVFNLCDDFPCPAPPVNEAAAAILGLPAPPEVRFEDAEL
ncbi:MAG: SDR family NAD(P)-dependent oxidoreductase, partial [Hyphomonadaceae bacterium]|nr:SDR family NAD(P)-dependent oxidoreductase [Hyphomonadaceae bacterium]